MTADVLVDTSVWVGHFRHRDDGLVALLNDGRVACHPYVVVEVACGTPPRRRVVLDLLRALEQVPVATAEELLAMIEQRSLAARGCGFVDVSLIASVLLSSATLLWTLDRKLDAVATGLNRSFRKASLS